MQECLVMFAKMIRKLLFWNTYILLLNIPLTFVTCMNCPIWEHIVSLIAYYYAFFNKKKTQKQTKQNVSLSWVVLEVHPLGRAVLGFPRWAIGSIPTLALQLASYASLRLTTLTCGMDFRALLQEFKFQMLSSWVPRDDCNTQNIVLKNCDVICTVFFGFY